MTYHPRYVLLHFARAVSDPVGRADLQTSMADARTALCLARGVALDDIDSASGYDISDRAYQSVRASWVWTIKQHGWASGYRPDCELPAVFALWELRRPDLTATDSADAWLADGAAAHHAYWASLGWDCNRPTCELHEGRAS